MNFVQNLEESLRDLASEARKRHPGVKEASERATLRLRALQNQYVSQVRQANNAASGIEHPTTRLFGNSEILHPFLLAANYPNASAELLEIAFRAMRLLMEADAILAADAIQMLRVWMIQAQSVVSFYQKQYAKEILLMEQEEQADTQSQQLTTKSAPTAATTTSSSSWFSWGSSSSSSVTATVADSSTHSASSSNKALVHSTKSSTTSSQQSPAQMEHRAKQILSCLLQLLESLKQHPDQMTVEIWTNATALSCIWLHYTPMKHTVHQAARSTLRQIMTLLFSTTPTTRHVDKQLLLPTWDDLLQLADTSNSSSSSSTNNIRSNVNLSGAYQLCKRSVAQPVTIHPPSSELALEILTQLLREHNKQATTLSNSVLASMSAKLLQKTMGISVKLLQDKRSNLTKLLRIMQWTCVLFQTYSRQYPSECRELFALLLKPIVVATEACRTHDDFEDGYVYESDSGDILASGMADDSGKRARLLTLIPPSTLWRAAFALEAIHNVLDREETAQLLLEDERIVAGLSETLSDFATIGASCMDHILQLVSFGKSLPFTRSEVFAKTSVKVKPTFFRKADQACTSGNVQSLLMDYATSKSTEKSSSGTPPGPGILGEALWISLQNLLRISECMNDAKGVEQMLEQTFAPSLAVLQHFLKRCFGSNDLVQLALMGFVNLADVCLPMSVIHRKALLVSLCKLSLPTWGRRDPSCQLHDHHVMTLLYLCRIIHAHFESIEDEWDLVIRTLDELSIITIASKHLSDEAYHAALALSILFSRLAPFTACFSVSSLLKLANAMVQIAKARLEGVDVVGDNTVLAERIAPSEKLVRQTSGGGGESSISSKIINIGARAIYGNGIETEKHAEDAMKDRTAIMFYEDYRRDFVKRLSAAQSTIRVASVGNIPYVLAVFVDTVMVNSFRFDECGDALSELLSTLASTCPAVRPFAMDILSVVAMSHLSHDRSVPTSFVGPGRLIFTDPMQSQLWAVETCDDVPRFGEASTNVPYDTKSQSDLLSPLCLKIQSADKPAMAESSLGALNSILEGVGHNMAGDVWCHVIDAVASLSGDPTYQRVDRTADIWSNCSSMGFRCLKFIVDDFRDHLSRSPSADKVLTSLLDCCSSFGRSSHDVNISLTAVTLLWTIADQDRGTDSIERALSRLVDLASDSRAEVRNATVNTIFSCIVGRGGNFTHARWELCFSNTIFGVYDLVAIKAGIGDSDVNGEQRSAKRYQVSLHHSRDSNQKQWLETQTLVLRGLTRVLRNYFSHLLKTLDDAAPTQPEQLEHVPWFQNVWVKVLDCSFEAAIYGGGRDTIAIRTAGVELMVLCCQLASDAGIEAATAPARVNTSMEVVNGALRNVRESLPVKEAAEKCYCAAVDGIRKQFFLEAFDALEAYSEAITKDIKHGGSADETQVQVLHSFVTGLSQLYDCSKLNEMAPRNGRALRKLGHFAEPTNTTDEASDLEARFVIVISAMMAVAGGYSNSRFLNQGQRVSINLLRTMASNNSAVSFDELIRLAGFAFFAKKSDTSSVLSYEAAEAVTGEVLRESVSNECKVFVLYQVLSILLCRDEELENGWNAGTDYANFIPVIVAGLAGVNKLQSDELFAVEALELVWESFANCLTRLLSITRTESGAPRMECISSLKAIISAAGDSVATLYRSQLCAVLSIGASNALVIARYHDDNMRRASTSGDEAETNRVQRDALLELFELNYSLSCRLQPDDETLKLVTTDALSKVLASYSEEMALHEFDEQVALIVCRCLQSDKLESLVISVFAQLSQLATAPSSSVRDAVTGVFKIVNVAAVLESARSKQETSEARAQAAERRVQELLVKVKQLQEKNVELTQEVAILQASSAM